MTCLIIFSSIDDNSFAGVPTVTDISLSTNQLTIVRKLMFAGLPNLESLALSTNQIVTIETGSFQDLAALNYLYLQNNDLETLPDGIFDPSYHPTALDTLWMTDNPFQCTYALCWLKEAESSWITVYQATQTTCDGPAALASRSWSTITTTDLQCGIPGE